MKIELGQADAIAKFIARFHGEVELSLNYSGRGMFGKECFGFELAEGLNPYEFVAKLGAFLGNQGECCLIEELCEKICVDSLGKGTIVYFPNYQWNSEEELPWDGEEILDDDVMAQRIVDELENDLDNDGKVS